MGGGWQRRYHSGPRESTRCVAAARGGPALGPHTRRWWLRQRGRRRTTGHAPAARDGLQPLPPSLGPWPRPGLAAAPGDSHARQHSVGAPGRRVPRCRRPPPGATYWDHASVAGLPPWSAPISPPPLVRGLVAAPTLRVPGVPCRSVGRRALSLGLVPDPPPGGANSRPGYPRQSRAHPPRLRPDPPQSLVACPP
jgi:hypothetical protein